MLCRNSFIGKILWIEYHNSLCKGIQSLSIKGVDVKLLTVFIWFVASRAAKNGTTKKPGNWNKKMFMLVFFLLVRCHCAWARNAEFWNLPSKVLATANTSIASHKTDLSKTVYCHWHWKSYVIKIWINFEQIAKMFFLKSSTKWISTAIQPPLRTYSSVIKCTTNVYPNKISDDIYQQNIWSMNFGCLSVHMIISTCWKATLR